LGAILLTIGHGSPQQVLCLCGAIYDRLKTRNLLYLRTWFINALLAVFFFLFTLANIAFPPTQFCVGIPYLVDLMSENQILPFYLMSAVIILSAISGFWVFVRIFAEV
jgi:NADH:ubiquinone oxidoreductase subunit 4 (subunit M)